MSQCCKFILSQNTSQFEICPKLHDVKIHLVFYSTCMNRGVDQTTKEQTCILTLQYRGQFKKSLATGSQFWPAF